MPRARGTREHDVGGRERLVAAALRIFARKGYAATTVRDILRAAGVTAPVLYYHFGNKEGLFLAMAHEGSRKFDMALASALDQAGTAVEKIRGYCWANASVRLEFVDTAWILDAILSGPPEAAPKFDFRGKFANTIQQLQEFVQAGIESGELRACNVAHAALALLGAVEVVSRPHMYGMKGSDAKDQLDGMLSVILSGLAAPSASPGRRLPSHTTTPNGPPKRRSRRASRQP
jgi:AcrR family transcriptional regulator